MSRRAAARSNYRVVKRLGGFPCTHRQWRDAGHCRWVHGYDRWVEIEWQGERDERGWVVDFGGLDALKATLTNQFDHTFLVAPDDPVLATFTSLHEADVLSLRVMDPTMEGMARWVYDEAVKWTTECAPAARVLEVTCWENEKNAARFRR